MINKAYLAALVLLVLMMSGCVCIFVPVTGPNDIPYELVDAPECFPAGIHVINSDADFTASCTGYLGSPQTIPQEWDTNSYTYIAALVGDTPSPPYLAGVGKGPAGTDIIVTFGNKGHCGMVPMVYSEKLYCIRIEKTSLSIRMEIKDERRI